MGQRRHLGWGQARADILSSAVLGGACLLTYWLVAYPLSHVHTEPTAAKLIGALWAVISTIFVYRFSDHESVKAAVSRTSATVAAFVLCTVYLVFLPFHPWALALLVGLSALAVTLIGRPGDAITAAITAAVLMVVAAVSPHNAWEQPLLRLEDTVVGVIVGVAAAWAGLRLVRLSGSRAVRSPAPGPGATAGGTRTSASP